MIVCGKVLNFQPYQQEIRILLYVRAGYSEKSDNLKEVGAPAAKGISAIGTNLKRRLVAIITP